MPRNHCFTRVSLIRVWTLLNEVFARSSRAAWPHMACAGCEWRAPGFRRDTRSLCPTCRGTGSPAALSSSRRVQTERSLSGAVYSGRAQSRQTCPRKGFALFLAVPSRLSETQCVAHYSFLVVRRVNGGGGGPRSLVGAERVAREEVLQKIALSFCLALP